MLGNRVRDRLGLCAMALTLSSVGALAQTPLSAIDWLDDPSPVINRVAPLPVALPKKPVVNEPPVSAGVRVPQVSVAPLGEGSAREAVGLLAGHVTGLPETLWEKSEAEALSRLIAQADFAAVPALQELLFTLMLAEAVPPLGLSAEAFLAERTHKLMAFGAIDAAEAMVARLPIKSAAHFDLWFDLTLLAGLEDKACAELAERRGLSDNYAAQVFCAMRGGDWQAASLLFETADALSLISRSERRLLQAFLDPELAEAGFGLAPPRNITPLEFRLYEAVGNPLPTAALPLAFAVADLRELAGWKAQLEAAERLTRAQAVSPNVLLGQYSARKPSASGGVWERARAVQALDRALEGASEAELSAALLTARRRLGDVGLEPLFAKVYAPELKDMPLNTAAKAALFEMTLLTDAYESAEPGAAGERKRLGFLKSLAQGAPEGGAALDGPLALALERGFNGASELRPHLKALLENGRLGEAILTAAGDMARGLDGDLPAMESAVVALRQMGLEDITRRAALQMMILGEARG